MSHESTRESNPDAIAPTDTSQAHEGRSDEAGYQCGHVLNALKDLGSALRAERAKVEAVRALHQPKDWRGKPHCVECSYDEFVPHPCPTIQAIERTA